MSATHHLLKTLRHLHLYLGIFSAPALLFLAFSGGLQSLNLHEMTRGSHYKPPAWIVDLSHMHKKQTFDVPKRPPQGQPGNAAQRQPDATTRSVSAHAPSRPWAMKIFFVLIALSLMLSTLSGLYMGWRSTRHRRRFGAALAAGIVVPVLLALL